MNEADKKAAAYFAKQKADLQQSEEEEREQVLQVLKKVIDFITDTLEKLDYPVDRVPVRMVTLDRKERAVWGMGIHEHFGLLADGSIVQKHDMGLSVLNPFTADLHLLKKFVLYDLDTFVLMHLAELSGARNKKTGRLPGYPHDEIEHIRVELQKPPKF